ncbi:MAG: hypothetical protein LBQ22_09700 [Bacteroidales bacterium]|jgi:hypothetical protein|nr:hypothetical protein [Bacteroidales bacterium]
MRNIFIKFIVFFIFSAIIFSCGPQKSQFEKLKDKYENKNFSDCKSYIKALNEVTDIFLDELEKLVMEEEHNFYEVGKLFDEIYSQAILFESECPEMFENYDQRIISEFEERFPQKDIEPSEVFPPRSKSENYKKLRLKYKDLNFENCSEYLNALNDAADVYLTEIDILLNDLNYLDNVYEVEVFFHKIYELSSSFEEECSDEIEEFNYTFQTELMEKVQELESTNDYPYDEEYLDVYEEDEIIE